MPRSWGIPRAPTIFLQATDSIVGGEAIVLPAASFQVEHERGRRASAAHRAEAEAGIGGFVCVNDVTARDLQKTDGQWARAKGFDTFCPVGARVVSGLDWRTLEVIGRGSTGWSGSAAAAAR